MGANEKHAAAYHGRADTTIAEASAAIPAPTLIDPTGGFGDIDVAAAEPDDYEDLLRKVQG